MVVVWWLGRRNVAVCRLIPPRRSHNHQRIILVTNSCTVQTHSEVRYNPSSGAVTSADNRADRQQDINRKIKVFGVISAFREG